MNAKTSIAARLKPLFFPAAIALACLAAYANSFHGAFVFDDPGSIADNPSIRHLWPIGPVLMPPWTEDTFMTTSGRPIINLSLALNYAVGGTDVVGYHVVNLVIHVLAAWTLFGLCRRTFLLERLGTRLNASASALAGVIALLWALHPLQTESVTYVVQRAESIGGLFYLLMLYGLVRAATASGVAVPSSESRGRSSALRWSILSLLCCWLGMASKETMATVPFVALVYDRLLLADSFRDVIRRRWKLYLGYFLSLALLGALMISTGGRGGTAGTVENLARWEYARSQFGVITHYLRLAFWPDRLVLDYGWPTAEKIEDILPQALLVAGLLGLTIWLLLRKRKEAALLGAWFFLILAPTSSIVPIADMAFEHRMYLPLAAVVAAVVLLIFSLLGRLKDAKSRRGLSVAIVCALCLAMAWRVHERNKDFSSPLRIWELTVADPIGAQNYRAHLNYGRTLEDQGRLAESLEQFNIGNRLFAEEPDGHNDRGRVLARLGRPEDAVVDFTAALVIKKGYAPALANRATAFLEMGRLDFALADANAAVQSGRQGGEAYDIRGKVYRAMGRPEDALADFTRAIQLAPDDANAYNNRSTVLARTGHLPEALADVNRAIALRRDLLEARVNRAWLYAQMGQMDLALKDFDQALQLKGDPADVYFSRSNAFLRNERLEEAVADLQKVLALNGRHAGAYNNLADIYLKQGKKPEAMEAINKAIECEPDSAVIHLTRAEVRMATGDYDGAWQDVRRGRELGSDLAPDLLEKLQKASGRKE